MAELMSARDVAASIGRCYNTACSMLAKGEIPGSFKMRNRWYVRRDVFEAWVKGSSNGRRDESVSSYVDKVVLQDLGEAAGIREPIEPRTDETTASGAEEPEASPSEPPREPTLEERCAKSPLYPLMKAVFELEGEQALAVANKLEGEGWTDEQLIAAFDLCIARAIPMRHAFRTRESRSSLHLESRTAIKLAAMRDAGELGEQQ